MARIDADSSGNTEKIAESTNRVDNQFGLSSAYFVNSDIESSVSLNNSLDTLLWSDDGTVLSPPGLDFTDQSGRSRQGNDILSGGGLSLTTSQTITEDLWWA